MNKNILIGMVVLLSLVAVSFATTPEMFGKMEQIPKDVHITFMQAMHEGNYMVAKELNEEHGLGGNRMKFTNEEMFDLKVQIRDAMEQEDYELAYNLKHEMRELVKQEFPEGKQLGRIGEMKGMNGKQKRVNGEQNRMNMKNNMNCPYLQVE